MLELIAKDPRAFIQNKAGPAFPSTASADYDVFQSAVEDESVLGQIVSAQREELEREITGLQAEAERVAEEARELAGEVPF